MLAGGGGRRGTAVCGPPSSRRSLPAAQHVHGRVRRRAGMPADAPQPRLLPPLASQMRDDFDALMRRLPPPARLQVRPGRRGRGHMTCFEHMAENLNGPADAAAARRSVTASPRIRRAPAGGGGRAPGRVAGRRAGRGCGRHRALVPRLLPGLPLWRGGVEARVRGPGAGQLGVAQGAGARGWRAGPGPVGAAARRGLAGCARAGGRADLMSTPSIRRLVDRRRRLRCARPPTPRSRPPPCACSPRSCCRARRCGRCTASAGGSRGTTRSSCRWVAVAWRPVRRQGAVVTTGLHGWVGLACRLHAAAPSRGCSPHAALHPQPSHQPRQQPTASLRSHLPTSPASPAPRSPTSSAQPSTSATSRWRSSWRRCVLY